MKKVNSEETAEEFVAKLPKGNMFSRRSSRRLSLVPSNGRVTEEDFHIKPRDAITKPLMDLGNQSGRHKENFKTYEKRYSNKKNVQKSALLKEFHELRKSRISSGVSDSRLTVATPSQNNPILLSARKRTPFASGRNPLFRGKSPAKVTSIKRFDLRASSCKKVSVHSSGKKGIFHQRNEIAKVQMRKNIENSTVDQDCRRALWFSEDEEYEEAEKENTKPLPAFQLSTDKTSGSMLHRRSTISLRSHHNARNDTVSTSKYSQTSSQSSKNYTTSDKPKTKEIISQRGSVNRRYSSIPSINKSQPIKNKQRRRSEMPTSIDFLETNENGLSPISEKTNSGDSGGLLTAFTKPSSKRNSRIPLLVDDSRVPFVVETRKLPQIILSPPSNDSCVPFVVETRKLPQIIVSPPFNDSSNSLSIDRKIEGLLTESFTIDKDLDNKACAKCSSKVLKDSETNTSDLNEGHQKYLEEMKTRMEKAFSDQQKLENELNVVTQEYFQKGKKIMQEYKNTFICLNNFVNDFKHILTLPVNSTQNDKKKIERIKSEPVISKYAKKEYKFLGTPLSKKNKKLMHSFSDPPTPTEKSPVSPEASFHSLDSVISPFQNLVGDLERPSLMPMTPGSRLNFTNLKSCLNEQLDILFQ